MPHRLPAAVLLVVASTFAPAVAADDQVDLRVYNSSGQLVSTLVEGYRSAGLYLLRWDGRDDAGVAVASGTYLYRLEVPAQGLIETRAMTLVR